MSLLFDKTLGLAGERKAFALLCLAFYTAFFLLLSLLLANAPPDQPEVRAWWACFFALGACYGVSFFSLAAGWFWARWFAIGLGYSGVTVAFWSVVTTRAIEPTMAFYGLTHGVIALFLQGQRLSDEFDAKPAWRKLFGVNDEAVLKVRNAVTRAAASLPTLILIALSPRGEAEGLVAVALTIGGMWALLRHRTVGVLALCGAAPLAVHAALVHAPVSVLHVPHLSLSMMSALPGLGALAGLFLVAAALPFVRPITQYLRHR